MKTITTLTITRYPAWAIPFAFFSMALFRLSLIFKKDLLFWRLMGSGKNGTFDKTPDLKQWAILGVFPHDYFKGTKTLSQNQLIEKAYGSFVAKWFKIFHGVNQTYILEPIEGHGLWNGKPVFGNLPKNSDYQGEIAVMTRATIRLSKLRRFWQHVPDAAIEMAKAEGFMTSFGLGEMPWIKQATFSIWKSKESMVAFAYRSQFHKEIVRKTHQENWYSEDMFVRFKVLAKF